MAISISPFKEGKEGEVTLSDCEIRSIISELKHSLIKWHIQLEMQSH
jgi:hypothetical protein